MGKSQKGGQFERDISKQLSLWLTKGERDDIFWRSSQSGGRATERSKKGKKTAGSYGDITALDPIGHRFLEIFCIELKRGYTKDTDAINFIDSKKAKPTLLQFWDQCVESRVQSDSDECMVIFKRDGKMPCVMIEFDMLERLEQTTKLINFSIVTITLNDKYAPVLAIMSLHKFLEWLDPGMFT